ncbi:MAG TPA: hypothetical protein VMX13_11005 [Sedimentisphaerales bacterium]|nr:hypothetical protein [Sedimentisphaerales bacterium]
MPGRAIRAGLTGPGSGALARSTVTGYWARRLAEVAIWNTDLDDADAALLAKGASPLFVRPANLVRYWPLIRGGRCRISGGSLTDQGSPGVARHPRLLYPGTTPYRCRPRHFISPVMFYRRMTDKY